MNLWGLEPGLYLDYILCVICWAWPVFIIKKKNSMEKKNLTRYSDLERSNQVKIMLIQNKKGAGSVSTVELMRP